MTPQKMVQLAQAQAWCFTYYAQRGKTSAGDTEVQGQHAGMRVCYARQVAQEAA
jgi:hypothetical protein